MNSETFKSKQELGLKNNKDMKINQIFGININYFRKFKNQQLKLGNNITVIFGRNGTLKSTVMGLIAQPFRTDQKDIFGKPMQTKFSDIFKLSTKTDFDTYSYDILMNINDDLKIKEPIPLYPEKKPGTNITTRYRLVPSGRAAGDGYFSLPSVYTKLNRLYPLIDTTLDNTPPSTNNYSYKESAAIGQFYTDILLRPDFAKNEPFNASNGKISKHSFGPKQSYYDKDTISSGEDNLSEFINTMISFERISRSNIRGKLNGIWSIDEFESSLHPVAQRKLFDYLYKWSKEYKVQIILNTHSLYLIQYVLGKINALGEKYSRDIILNEITSAYVDDNELAIVENPEYSEAYSELTLAKYTDTSIAKQLKVKIFCEDKVAKDFLKAILNTKNIMQYVDWEYETKKEQPGTSYVLLNKLGDNYPSILDQVNGILISDGEVTTLSKYDRHYKIPSLQCLPFEKELVYWINSLNGNDEFFKNLKKPKDIFHNEFNDFQLPITNKKESYVNTKTKFFKNWYKNNLRENKKIMTRYIKANSNLFDPFRKEIYYTIYEILKSNGIIIEKPKLIQ